MAEVLGSWTLNYLPEAGGRVTGTLTVSDEDVRFVALYDSSNATILKGIVGSLGAFAASGGHATYMYDKDSEIELVLPSAEIKGTDAVRKGLMKRVVIAMENGERFVFDYGLLSVKKIVAAIKG